MISMAPTLPPVTLTDEAMKLCAALLAIAADPAGTKSRLDELTAATAAYRSAIEEHAAVSATAAQVTAQQETVTARERAVADREQGLAKAQTAVDVAGSGNVARAQALNNRTFELDQREAELAAREKNLADRLAAYRQALA
jgi:hypothetical protein